MAGKGKNSTKMTTTTRSQRGNQRPEIKRRSASAHPKSAAVDADETRRVPFGGVDDDDDRPEELRRRVLRGRFRKYNNDNNNRNRNKGDEESRSSTSSDSSERQESEDPVPAPAPAHGHGHGHGHHSHSFQTMEAGVLALTQLLQDVKRRVDRMDDFIIPEVREQLKEQNSLVGGFKKSLDGIYGAVKNAPKPSVPGKMVLEECTEMEKSEAARRDARRGEQADVLENLWRDIVEQDAFLARTHLGMVREEMEKKLSRDGRRAEAEILIQEMLDRFRSDLEQEYDRKIKEAKIILKEEAHCAAWDRLFEEILRRKRELQELMERRLQEEKERLLEFFREDFETYREHSTQLLDRLVELLEERNNMAMDFMALQADYKRFIELEKGEDQWQHMMELRDYQVRGERDYTDKWTPLVIPETLLPPMPWWEEDRGLVIRDPELSPRDSRDVTGNPQTTSRSAIPENLTQVPENLKNINANSNFRPSKTHPYYGIPVLAATNR